MCQKCRTEYPCYLCSICNEFFDGFGGYCGVKNLPHCPGCIGPGFTTKEYQPVVDRLNGILISHQKGKLKVTEANLSDLLKDLYVADRYIGRRFFFTWWKIAKEFAKHLGVEIFLWTGQGNKLSPKRPPEGVTIVSWSSGCGYSLSRREGYKKIGVSLPEQER